MSHFTVVVRVSEKVLQRHNNDLKAALSEMLEPYNEQGNDRRYQEFEDVEEEYREKYATETCRCVQSPNGEIFDAYDRTFKNPRYKIFGSMAEREAEPEYKYPTDYRKVDVPFKQRYRTFDQFMTAYAGYQRKDPEKGRYGYWRNPNAKWDWWVIGGRWKGFFPVRPGIEPRVGESGAFRNDARPGRSDIVRVQELDLDTIARETRESAERFFLDYRWYVDHPNGPPPPGQEDNKLFEWDTRDRALHLGLLRVEQGPAQARDAGERAISWSGKNLDPKDERLRWTDIATVFDDKDEFLRRYIDCFNPIASYAALDADGWHAPGEMGWFGCSDATPESVVQFKKTFVERFIRSALPTDTLVGVDCHI